MLYDNKFIKSIKTPNKDKINFNNVKIYFSIIYYE